VLAAAVGGYVVDSVQVSASKAGGEIVSRQSVAMIAF
jgi:hypothetical protein